MRAGKTTIDYSADPNEALAKSEGQRYASLADYRNILNERENELLAESEKSGPRSEAYLNAKRDVDKAEGEFERIHGVIRRPPNHWHIRGWILIATACVLALLEAPVNKFLFDVALQSSNFASYTIAVVFAAALLLLAHVAGKSLRQIWSEHRKRIVWSSLSIFILMVVVLSTLVSILTVARAAFSANGGSFQDLFSNVSSTITQLGFFGAVGSAFSDISALVLATVNIGCIFMTMMLAFFTHDPDKDFDEAERAVMRHRRQMASTVARYLRQRAAIVKKFAPDIAGHSTNYKSANKNVIELKKRLGLPLTEQDNWVIDELDTLAEESEHFDPGNKPIHTETVPPLKPGFGGPRREPPRAVGA